MEKSTMAACGESEEDGRSDDEGKAQAY